MRWNKRSTIARAPVPSRSSITVTAGYSTCRFGTPSGSPQAGIEPSVGSAGDSYDNALAESIIGLYKAEEIRRRGPWKGVEEVELATLEWVAWYNTRLLEPLGYVPPDEFEQAYYRHQTAPTEPVTLT